jgi:hypothetical protein
MQNRIVLLPNATIFLIIAGIVFTIFNIKAWKQENRVINWDVLEYYSYLPATIIHKDISLKFTEGNPAHFSKKFWPHRAPNNALVLKMTMGMSILYSPFFMMAHYYTLFTKDFAADGFTIPYQLALILSSVFYIFLGLLFLRNTLLRFFTPLVTAITLLLITAGTNLYFYASFEAAMSHAFSFFLFSAFLFFTVSWHKNITLKKTFYLGILTGMITLIRPTNTVIILFFIFYGITNWKSLQMKILRLLDAHRHIIFMGIIAFLVWVPQLMYWKHITNQWLYYSYGDQGFFFDQPQILNGLFSFRKGWFIYTPLMMVAITAILLHLRYLKEFFLPLLVFLVVNVFVVLSWWCWWYGGSFGLRAFIESYALLAVPLALLIRQVLKLKIFYRIASLAFFALFAVLNIFQSYQYYYGAIHWDSMTKEAYFESFGKRKPGEKFKELLKAPDYEKAMKGIKEYP